MESRPQDSHPHVTPDAARAGLHDVSSAREHIARRIAAPWWYRAGVSLSTLCMFVGMSLLVGRPSPGSDTETASLLLVALGACVAPIVLLWALHRATGISVDRYARGMTRWCVETISLLVVSFVLQAFLDVPFALAAAGGVALVLTYVNERRIDASLRERVRAGA